MIMFIYTSMIDSYTVIQLTKRSDHIMNAVTVSPKFQIVIPKAIRESLGIVSGQKVQVIPYQNRIELVPIKPIKELRGFLKGISSDVKREKDRL